ncbi:hypothetical protein TVAG_259560 [Trichomonas vaginalis G3]|uniref:Thioredoxin domain-containing protein n=1 Tax=Trichomonas vaginalis (strain ATCC PRA-98 / G3) TaxID=412133 RepID=A2GB90_TRIV3|nr:thioredoxin-like family [Trichomonas vaginalis G3]EAX85580.1 hypothetical protein TVAG_259560 [Trichomonas vaginalis G3]KAI5538721.1 thioredoxin-like family [Trichomonas vaginalis G3]|eukprot:XP_001298510.1 hypothetical protein [Trichomonas vaginalis G3]
MFAFLIHGIQAEFIRFSYKKYLKLKEKSFEKPIFAIAYSPYCGHCTEIPNESMIFRQRNNKRDDFYFTLLNCGEGDACSHFTVPHTPYQVIIQGDEKDYWPETKTHTALEWEEFVNKTLQPHLTKIQDQSEIENYKSNLTEGGTLFYLQVQSESSIAFKLYQKIAKQYYIYQDIFLYQIVPYKTEKVIAYTSPNCPIEYNQLSLLQGFVDEYKFGGAHRYLYNELANLHHSQVPSAVLLVEDTYTSTKINDGLKNDILDIADKHCGVKTGWMSFQYNEGFLKDHKIHDDEMPLLVYHGNNCLNYYRGRMSDVIDTDFMNLSISGQLCGKNYNNVDGSENITVLDDKKGLPKTLWWKAKISGWTLAVIYMSSAFAILASLAVLTPYRSKSRNTEKLG